jgi:hypothetical protein
MSVGWLLHSIFWSSLEIGLKWTVRSCIAGNVGQVHCRATASFNVNEEQRCWRQVHCSARRCLTMSLLWICILNFKFFVSLFFWNLANRGCRVRTLILIYWYWLSFGMSVGCSVFFLRLDRLLNKERWHYLRANLSFWPFHQPFSYCYWILNVHFNNVYMFKLRTPNLPCKSYLCLMSMTGTMTSLISLLHPSTHFGCEMFLRCLTLTLAIG